MTTTQLSRREFLKGGALVVGFSFTGMPFAFAQTANNATTTSPHTLNPNEIDAFLAVRKDGSVIVYSGKVDLGTGHRIAMRQMVAEELPVAIERIELIEGDTALTPDQGSTAGSTGIVRGGAQLRLAAASARDALIALGAVRLQRSASELALVDGNVQATSGAGKVGIGELVGDKTFSVRMNPKAQLKDAAHYAFIGQSLPRPDLPAKMTGRHTYVHDFTLPNMLHGRAVRPPAVGAKLLAVDEASLKNIPGARIVRIQDFLGVVAEDEWAAVRAAREIKVRWSEETPLVGHEELRAWARRGPFVRDEILTAKGTQALATAPNVIRATYYWPVQSHGSIGPSCSLADIKADRATIWTASQATHRYRDAYAQMLGMPRDQVRLIYLDGAGCYGMNGHDDAAADAIILSQAIGRPVRVQWMREDELGWDPKGPPQLLELRATLNAENRIGAWETEMWLPLATANLEHVPLLGPQAAGIAQPVGQSVGAIAQNGDPPYGVDNIKVAVHWLARAPLRPSNIRAPGKVGNCFAVESFVDELAAAAHVDPLEFRLRGLTNPRAIEVLKRTASLIGWTPRTAYTAQRTASAVAGGYGISYVHYKQNENQVAIAMQVEVDRKSGEIHVKRVACTHDCGLMINPDAVRAQVEGGILQTLSRTLYEETKFDRSRVTSVDWNSYPLLRFPAVPELTIELIDRRFDPPFGAGEAATSPVPAALANAVFDATGARLREAPFTPARVLAALQAVA